MSRRPVMSLWSVPSATGRAQYRPASPTLEQNSAGENGERGLYCRHPLDLLMEILISRPCMAASLTVLGRRVLSYTSDPSSLGTVRTIVCAAGLGGCIVSPLLYLAHFLFRVTLSKCGVSNNQLMKVDDIRILFEFFLLGAIFGPCGLALMQATLDGYSGLRVEMLGYMGAIGCSVVMAVIGAVLLSTLTVLGIDVIRRISIFRSWP
ncbi:hypothetical protein GGF50DRAFT_57867 [Schizophyllum commune]